MTDDAIDAGRAVRGDVSVMLRPDGHRHQKADISPEHFIALIAPQPFGGGVEMGHAIRAVDHHDSIDGLLQPGEERPGSITLVDMHQRHKRNSQLLCSNHRTVVEMTRSPAFSRGGAIVCARRRQTVLRGARVPGGPRTYLRSG
jgi:hypothetical protein